MKSLASTTSEMILTGLKNTVGKGCNFTVKLLMQNLIYLFIYSFIVFIYFVMIINEK